MRVSSARTLSRRCWPADIGLLSDECGLRSLGNRGILADPRRPDTQKTLNLKIKYREGFRPFAPSVLAEECSTYFDLEGASPYMLLVAPVLESRRTPVVESLGEPLPVEHTQGMLDLSITRAPTSRRSPTWTFGSHTDGASRDQRALLEADQGV